MHHSSMLIAFHRRNISHKAHQAHKVSITLCALCFCGLCKRLASLVLNNLSNLH